MVSIRHQEHQDYRRTTINMLSECVHDNSLFTKKERDVITMKFVYTDDILITENNSQMIKNGKCYKA